jgi:hypothetical protein
VSALYDPRRVANDRGTRRHVTRHHTASTNNRIVADGSAGENDSATADPDMPANPDGSSEFKTLAPLRPIARMIGRVDLDSWTDLRPLSNSDLNHVKDHAIEVEEDIRSQANVETIITVERWADNGPLAYLPEALGKENAPLIAR